MADPDEDDAGPDRGAIIAELRSFPEEQERSFERCAVKLGQSHPQAAGLFRSILEDGDLEEPVRYAAFFTLGTLYRRRKDHSKLNDLVERYASDLAGHGTYHHLRSMAVREKGGPSDWRNAYDYARRAARMLPDHAGVLHSLAALVAAALEQNAQLGLDRGQLLDEAQEALRRARDADPGYPKFYVTLGRLQALASEFDAAKSSVLHAIDLEDSGASDYDVRLADYNRVLLEIQLREASAELRHQVDAATEQVRTIQEDMGQSMEEVTVRFQGFVDRAESRYVQLLGFFAAVVALIVSGVQIGARLDGADAVALLVTLSGTLLVTFGGLGVLIAEEWRKIVGLVVLGAGLLGTGVFLL